MSGQGASLKPLMCLISHKLTCLKYSTNYPTQSPARSEHDEHPGVAAPDCDDDDDDGHDADDDEHDEHLGAAPDCDDDDDDGHDDDDDDDDEHL